MPTEAGSTHKSQVAVVSLAGKPYVLLEKITAGQLSVVWKAVQLDIEFDPSFFRRVEETDQELIDYLRDAEAPSWIPKELEKTLEERGPLVALKVARAGKEELLRKEAKVLDGFRDEAWHKSGKAQVVRMIQPSPPTPGAPLPDTPFMILEWAKGEQLDKLPRTFTEKYGLFVTDQLVSALAFIYGAKGLVLTDTIKPNSLFWDQEAESLVLTDWNVLGSGADDFRKHTLPMLGNTLHRLFVGKQVEWEKAQTTDPYRVDPKSVGGTTDWSRLTYGTVMLIRRTLLADFMGGDPNQLIRQVLTAVQEQWSLWDEGPDRLINRARSEQDEAAVRCYDLARARLEEQGNELEREDTQRMLDQLKRVIVGYQEGQHDTALITLSWARARYPSDRELRWAWLAHTGARELTAGARKLVTQAWQDLRAREFRVAIEPLEEAEVVFDTLKKEITDDKARAAVESGRAATSALRAEAQIWDCIQRSEMEPSERTLAEAEQVLSHLVAVWRGPLSGEDAPADTREAVSNYRERVGRIQDLKKMALRQLKNGKVDEALRSFRDLEGERPGLTDLPLWIAATEHLCRERYIEVFEVLHPTDPSSPSLVEPGSEHVCQMEHIAARGLRDAAIQAGEQNCFKRATMLLEPVERHVPGDGQARKLLQRYRKLEGQYEELRSAARRTQPYQNEIEALDRWIDAGFNFDTDGYTPGQDLVTLRFGRTLAWAEQSVKEQRHADAIRLLHERVIPDLHKPRASETLDEGTRRELEMQAREKIDAWKAQQDPLKAQQKQQAEKFLQQAEDLFGLYASPSPVRPPGYDTAEQMISDRVAHAKALVRQVLSTAGEHQDTCVALMMALESFQRGRLALKRGDTMTARHELELADQYATDWEGFGCLVRPYLKQACLAQQVDLLESTTGRLEDIVGCIVKHIQTQRELSALAPVDDTIFDVWLNTLLKKTAGNLRARLEAETNQLEAFLDHWLAQWPHLSAGGNALSHRAAYQNWLDVLPRRQEASDTRTALDSPFERCRRKILAQCNYDLARSLLLQAQEHAEKMRIELAKESEAEALALAQEAVQILEEKTKLAARSRQRLVTEISWMLEKIWRRCLAMGDVSSSLDCFNQMLGRDGLRFELGELADLLLAPLSLDRREIIESFENALISTAKLEQLAIRLNRYKPGELTSLLCSHEASAMLVRIRHYSDAFKIAQKGDELHGQENRQPLVDELKTSLQAIWKERLQDQDWLMGLDAVDDVLNGEPALKDLSNGYLSQELPADLGSQCDEWIKNRADVTALSTALAACAPDACRTVLYHLDRAATLVAASQFQQAYAFVEAIEQIEIEGQSETRLKTAIEEQIRSFWHQAFEQIQNKHDRVAEILHEGLQGRPWTEETLTRPGAPRRTKISVPAGPGTDSCECGQSSGPRDGQQSVASRSSLFTREQVLDLSDLLPLARQFGPPPQDAGPDLWRKKAEQILNVALGTVQTSGVFGKKVVKPSADEFARLMTEVSVEQWNTDLRDGLCGAFADRYEKQSEDIRNPRLMGIWHWWRNRASVRQAARDAQRFLKLTCMSAESETTVLSAGGSDEQVE